MNHFVTLYTPKWEYIPNLYHFLYHKWKYIPKWEQLYVFDPFYIPKWENITNLCPNLHC